LLKRASQEENGKWGVPASKIQISETPIQAARRELQEETGIYIDDGNRIIPLKTLYIKKPQGDYVFQMFDILLDKIPQAHLS
jgi:8-oxo-dGTP pyrophosphatase MutT (NUDIX family)